MTSVLLYYMAFVFMGKGLRELQEGNAIPITVIPGFPTVEALGLYPTWQTVLGQMVLLALFVFALAKTFWPKRSVALPTMAPAPVATPAAIDARFAQIQAENAYMAGRLAAIEVILRARETERDSGNDS